MHASGIWTRHLLVHAPAPGRGGWAVVLAAWEVKQLVFRHDISYHGPVLRACCVLDQLMLENGEPLFSVEYSDE